jgi:hypothetical protein
VDVEGTKFVTAGGSDINLGCGSGSVRSFGSTHEDRISGVRPTSIVMNF